VRGSLLSRQVLYGRGLRTIGEDAPEAVQTVAIYARVSTEDQAERATIKSQLDFLRRFVDLHDLPVAGEYVDDGISGTVPLADRPEGQRLLIDAEAGRFGTVLVYRIDRFGRSLRSLLESHDALDAYGVAIRSATEPFDSGSPIGAFLFQLLGSLAELEKSTIVERTGLGRNRIAGTGGYTGGPIPLGYDIDAENRIVASQRIVPELGMTEAEFVRDLFMRMAGGSSSINSECLRLTALGVPRGWRYGGANAGKASKTGDTPRPRAEKRVTAWSHSMLGSILHNPVYKGEADSIHDSGASRASRQPLLTPQPGSEHRPHSSGTARCPRRTPRIPTCCAD
jgi:site-specific DNA recombinase